MHFVTAALSIPCIDGVDAIVARARRRRTSTSSQRKQPTLLVKQPTIMAQNRAPNDKDLTPTT